MVEKDDLDRRVEETTKRDPEFRALIRAAQRRQRFGRMLAEKREALGISRRALAKKMKTSATVVDRIEDGGDVQLSTRERYVAALGRKLALELRLAVP
jgi:ribosome-binding protein aMBF1 (putative translation factor)